MKQAPTAEECGFKNIETPGCVMGFYLAKKMSEQFDIPRGAGKKEYKKLLKESKEQSSKYLEKIREMRQGKIKSKNATELINNIEWHQVDLDLWVEKTKRIEMVLRFFKNNKEKTSIEYAKQIPISDYVVFNNAGFARCLWHEDKHPSMKYYQKENKVWCFSCSCGGDVID